MDGKRGSSTGRARLVRYSGRPIGIRWRLGDQAGEVSSGTTDREQAIGVKAVLLRDLAEGILPGKESSGLAISWPDFRLRYQAEYLAGFSEGSISAWTTAANHLERLHPPKRLADVDKERLSMLRSALTEKGLSPNSVATYLRAIRVALGWAYDMDLIATIPRLRAPKGIKKTKTMRSKPINTEGYERILMAVPKVRPKDPEIWVRFIKGLWHSSLRIDELRRLSWDQDAELSIDESLNYPMILMLAEGHKSREDRYQPMTPEFWKLISSPGLNRAGYVFPLPGRNGGQMTRKRVIRVVSAIGRRAGVITDTRTRKTATSHDIGRRASLTRLSKTLTLSQTQQWARHADPRTTTQFYIRDEAEALAEAAGWTPGKELQSELQ